MELESIKKIRVPSISISLPTMMDKMFIPEFVPPITSHPVRSRCIIIDKGVEQWGVRAEYITLQGRGLQDVYLV